MLYEESNAGKRVHEPRAVRVLRLGRDGVLEHVGVDCDLPWNGEVVLR